MTRVLSLLAFSTIVFVQTPPPAQQSQPPQTPQAPRPQAPREPPKDPFTAPIEATKGVIPVRFVEFATIPDVNGQAPRLMHFLNEAATNRIFVSAMTGGIYTISYDGKTVTPYLDVNAESWGIGVQSRGSERGLQSFAFHPQFARRGTPGYGKFYTYTDTTNVTTPPDFRPSAENAARSHDMVLLEWTAKDPAAATYDGDSPRELLRIAHPFSNHNGGQIAFNPLATAGNQDYGLLYVGSADGGSGGDPMNMAQNLGAIFGKILRIDPLGNNSANGKYGIPARNPFVGKSGALGEIYALGVRNPQRFSWDSKTSKLYVADIGQNLVEEVSPVAAGANLGWNTWEASFKYVGGTIDLEHPRGDEHMTWPIVEFDHTDPLLLRGGVAVTGVYVYRQSAIRQLRHLMLFGDNPSGEIFCVDADTLPNGGQAAIRRVLLNDQGTNKTLLQLIKERNTSQGKPPATRADLRFGEGPQGQIFLMNKRDGVIRLLVPDGK